MSVRKRNWTTSTGEQKSGWQADYFDASGKRRRKMFDRKKDAEAFLVGAKVEVRDGIHVADSETITIAGQAMDGLGRGRQTGAHHHGSAPTAPRTSH